MTKTTPAPSHILVLDDDPPIQELIRDVLEGAGYEVACGEGPQGLAMAIERPPALILLDMMMPDMDGAELSAALQQHPATAGVPFVIMTAYQHPNLWYRTLGALDFIHKPFSINDLVRTVRRIAGPPPATQGETNVR